MVGSFSTSPISSILGPNMKVAAGDEKTIIAEFHTVHRLIKTQKVRLEIQAAGMVMLDYVILTFMFSERKRGEREGMARSRYGG